MNITQAKVVPIDGYPILRLIVDGHPAHLIEPKQTLLDSGLVILLDEEGHWESTLSEIFETEGRQIPIPGATRDPFLLALAQRFAAGEDGNLLEAK